MKCTVCGHDRLEVVIEEGLIIYICPECGAKLAQEDAEQGEEYEDTN